MAASKTTKGRKKMNEGTIGFPFYQYLQLFIRQEHDKIYKAFKPLSRKFLNFNNKKENKSAYLRIPQFEALEVYVFLKEFCCNSKLCDIFEKWYNKTDFFEGRLTGGIDAKGQTSLFGVDELHDEVTKENFKIVFELIKKLEQIYPNYIFALTMGLGKTTLMATSIFYEFLLANKYPKDDKYCHNALVFAPDKTVLQSLREIMTLDKSKVVPEEYLSFLDSNLKFHFLDDSSSSLNVLDGSDFNIIISNTQKIILKRKNKAKTATEDLFGSNMGKYQALSLKKWADIAAAAGIEDIENEADLTINNRFAKLMRLKHLGIYVDEAHHVFGTKLADDLMSSTKATSLRVTINELAENLKLAGTHVVGCYNYTGTPYVGNRLLPEVVYCYGLKEAIDNKYLKNVEPLSISNIRQDTLTFCRIAIKGFWEKCGERRVENMLPKMAIFSSSIEEMEKEVRPAVEKVLAELNIPNSKILVNVGDSTITKNDDLREFNNLDTPSSEKQFILLVGKGKEGWNCRSLFSVALHREPKSKVFVLQAAMRCLRQIGDCQETGYLFFSEENLMILDEELRNNFNVTLDDMAGAGDKAEIIEVRPKLPEVAIPIKKIRKLYISKEKKLKEKVDFKTSEYDLEKYKITLSKRNINDLKVKTGIDKDVSSMREQRKYTPITLSAEIARYLNISPIKIVHILENSIDGMDNLCKVVNEYNDILYDEIIPRIFGEMFEMEEFEKPEEQTLKLVIKPDEGYFRFKKRKNIASDSMQFFDSYVDKSFHLDNYIFDSTPEMNMFVRLLMNKDQIDKVWFTGMLGDGQTEFKVHYIDPESHGVRSYYPDFLVRKKDGSYIIIEVKGENKLTDKVVLAKKDYAQQMANANNMTYEFIPSKKVGTYDFSGLQIKQFDFEKKEIHNHIYVNGDLNVNHLDSYIKEQLNLLSNVNNK